MEKGENQVGNLLTFEITIKTIVQMEDNLKAVCTQK